METTPLSILVIILIVSAVTDLRSQKILNAVTLPGMLAAIAYHVYANGLSGLYYSFAGLGLGMAFLIIPYMFGGMGAGDVKLMGAVGALLGAEDVFIAFIYTGLVGGIYSVYVLVSNRERFTGLRSELRDKILNITLTRRLVLESELTASKRPRLCYGVAIALGTFLHTILSLTGHSPFN